MLTGKKIYLSAVEEHHIDQFKDWRNQPNLRKYFREYRELNSSMQKEWFKKINSDREQVNFEIHDKESGKLIGHCGLYYIHWIHSHAEFGIYIGDENYRSGGYGSDALRTLIKYGFNDLNLNRIWCEVYDNNAALDVYKHIGFKLEGCQRNHYFNEGRYWNSHILGMLREDYDKEHE